MKELEPQLEAAAQELSTFGPHRLSGEGKYMCQWPEQDTAHAMDHGYIHLGAGCKGCLIGAMAMFVTGGMDWSLSLKYGTGDFTGEEARMVYMRTLELLPSKQQETPPRRMAVGR